MCLSLTLSFSPYNYKAFFRTYEVQLLPINSLIFLQTYMVAGLKVNDPVLKNVKLFEHFSGKCAETLRLLVLFAS